MLCLVSFIHKHLHIRMWEFDGNVRSNRRDQHVVFALWYLFFKSVFFFAAMNRFNHLYTVAYGIRIDSRDEHWSIESKNSKKKMCERKRQRQGPREIVNEIAVSFAVERRQYNWVHFRAYVSALYFSGTATNFQIAAARRRKRKQKDNQRTRRRKKKKKTLCRN